MAPNEQPFNVITKPIGAICNLDCEYCFYLRKQSLYPDTSDFKMTEDVLEEYVQGYLDQPAEEVTFTWQGGEPTLMGLDFYKKVVEYQEKYNTGGKRVQNSLQTNAVKIDDEWAAFLKEHDFLVGVSIDGPPHVHNHYRKFKGGQDSFHEVYRGLEHLRDHEVEYNVISCVNDYSGAHPLDIYDFFKEKAGTPYWQFIPIVERIGGGTGTQVADHSVGPEQYGDFLIQLFNRWVRRDLGEVSIQIFDITLRSFLGMNPGLCIFEETCGYSLAVEHNGDLYSCDHYVDPEHFLGNLTETPMKDLVFQPFQEQFGQDKKDTLPNYCLECEVRHLCNGGCPKNRFTKTPDGESGLNYLCAGYRKFFNYVDSYMKFMASQYRAGVHPMQMRQHINAHPEQFVEDIGRNDPCPCGSGKKYKKCCGR